MRRWARASFFNATARTADGFVGLIFRRPPVVFLPDHGGGVSRALAGFGNDVDVLGTSLYGCAKNVVSEVLTVGRAGTLVGLERAAEDRVYGTLHAAEAILDWHGERLNGRNLPTLVVLAEKVQGSRFAVPRLPRISNTSRTPPKPLFRFPATGHPAHLHSFSTHANENGQRRTANRAEWRTANSEPKTEN